MNSVRALHESFFSSFSEEAARILESFSVDEVLRLIEDTSGKNAANLLSHMNPQFAAEVLAALPDTLLLQTVAELSPHVAASLIGSLKSDSQVRLMNRIPERLAQEILAFMEYPRESVGSLMDSRVFALPEDLTIEQAIQQIRANGRQDLHDVYIIDRNHTLVGRISLRDLLLTPLDERLQSIMTRDLLTIHPLENREEIVELLNERKLLTIPVVDLDGHLLGVIRNEAIFQASHEDATADMQTMVGASADERALSPPLFAVKKRLPWLQINLLTAFLAAFVVGLFENTIAQFTALAVLLPVVAGQSGNTGAQSLAVVMRGLALRDIRPTQWFTVTQKEVSVAFVNGLAVAATTCLGVYVWSRSGGLTFVIGISMVASMVIAGLSGALIPITLRAMNQDPAQSSSIILTTVTDVVGFLSFLGLATLFSAWLV